MRIWVSKTWGILILLVMLTNYTVVLAEDDGKMDAISQAIKDDRTQRFQEKNQGQLRSLRQQYEEISYCFEAYQEYPYQFEGKDGNETGTLYQMILFFEQLTQLPFEQVNDIGTKDEMLEKLIDGSMELFLGMTMSERVASNFRVEFKTCNISPFQGELFYNPFLLIGCKQDAAYTKYSIPYYYWGCLEDQSQEIAGSELDEHTVTYNTLHELEQAFQEEQIQGMLLSQGREKYLAIFNKLDYSLVKEALIPATNYYITAKDNKVLNQLMPEMIELYISLYDEYFKDQIEAAITNEASNDNSKQDNSKQRKGALLVIGGVTVLFLGLSINLYRRHQQETKLKKLQELIPNIAKMEQDVLWVLVNQSKMSSKHHFRPFGLVQKHSKKMISMEDLTKKIGFDFQKHYAYIMKKQESEFICHFELYIRGVAYKFEEVGVYRDNVIVSKLYREQK